MNEFLMPASAIAIELLRKWMAAHPDDNPDRNVLSAIYEEALLSVMEGARRAKAEASMSKRLTP